MNRICQSVRRHIFLVLFSFVGFSVFGVLPTFSSTGTPSAPKLKFTKWQAGQGQEYTVSNPPHTFITDTETTCQITATVAYASSQPSSVYPLTSYTWSVTGSHGYTFTTETTASGAIDQIGTTFTLTATGTGDQHNSSTGGHRPMRGREEKPITFTVKFIGEYGSGSGSDQQTVEVEVVFEQDEKDQMRQEYLDVRRLHKEHRSSDTGTYGDLRIPSRGELGTSGQRFNNGHYSYLINKSLEDKILHWWQACDKYAYEELNNDDLKNDRGNKELRLTGGYRNPHHHVYHVYAGQSMSDVTYWSLHQFRLALDVGEVDMNGKNDIEGGYNGIDGNFMEEAARDYAGASWTSNNYRTEPHVHAQWGAVRNAPGKDSTSSQRSTKKTTTVNPITTTPETTPTTVTGACGVHTIASSETSQHVEKTGACGHKYYACTPGNHDKLQASCSTDSNCISTNFYLCQHTSHEYSRSEGRTCGHTPRHRWSFCPKNAAGERCIYHVYFRCTPHTHKYRNGETVVYTPPGETQQPRETQQPTQQPNQQPTVVYHPCGVHAATQRGDHTLQASCSETNSRGDRCTDTSFYQCQHASHTYPAPVSTRPCGHPTTRRGSHYWVTTCAYYNRAGDRCTNASGYYRCQPHTHEYPTRTPPPVVCPADAWTNCGGTVSHATTCPAEHSYYSCNPAAVRAHSGHKSKSNNNGNGNNNGNPGNSDSGSGSGNTPNAPTQTQPTTRPCGHSTSASGDHSMQASCSRDSRCIATNFYYCQHASHTYPAPPPDPDPVVCPAHSWTNCGGTVSHATTCPAGDPYYACNPEAVRAHASHTAPKPTPRVVCPADRWTNCKGTRSHATTCGLGHTYYTCNPSAVSSHRGHSSACPASQWTHCGGTKTHAKTCGRGHKYYTCNPSARRAHGWH